MCSSRRPSRSLRLVVVRALSRDARIDLIDSLVPKWPCAILRYGKDKAEAVCCREKDVFNAEGVVQPSRRFGWGHNDVRIMTDQLIHDGQLHSPFFIF